MAQMYLDEEAVEHSRQTYSLLDLLGDLGGASEVILICFGLIFYPISEFSFGIKALQKLYIARTSNPSLFISKKNKAHNLQLAKLKKKVAK